MWRVIIVFTNTSYWTLLSASHMQSASSFIISVRSILRLFSHLHTGLQSGLEDSHFSLECYNSHPSHLLCFNQSHNRELSNNFLLWDTLPRENPSTGLEVTNMYPILSQNINLSHFICFTFFWCSRISRSTLVHVGRQCNK
jgi:hypothetical protein